MELDIRKKIVTALAGVSGITGGIHFDITGDDPDTPYVKFWMVANETSRDTQTIYETIWIQFDCIEDSKSPANVETIGNDIYEAMEGAVLTLDNWTTVDVKSLHRPVISALDQNRWMSYTNIKIELQHN